MSAEVANVDIAIAICIRAVENTVIIDINHPDTLSRSQILAHFRRGEQSFDAKDRLLKQLAQKRSHQLIEFVHKFELPYSRSQNTFKLALYNTPRSFYWSAALDAGAIYRAAIRIHPRQLVSRAVLVAQEASAPIELFILEAELLGNARVELHFGLKESSVRIIGIILGHGKPSIPSALAEVIIKAFNICHRVRQGALERGSFIITFKQSQLHLDLEGRAKEIDRA